MPDYMNFQAATSDHMPKHDFSATLQCSWENVTNGQCTEEADFTISYSFPPCGCEDPWGNVHRYCARHLLRAFHSMMGKYYCPHCGRQYRGVTRLQHVDRL